MVWLYVVSRIQHASRCCCFFQAFAGFLRFVWLSLSPCGCGSGFVCIRVWFVICMWICRALAEAGSCLQSGSQQSPHLWPWHSRTTTNHLRVLFSNKEPFPHLCFPSFVSPHLLFPQSHLSIFQPPGHELWPCLQRDGVLICKYMTLQRCHLPCSHLDLSCSCCAPLTVSSFCASVVIDV